MGAQLEQPLWQIIQQMNKSSINDDLVMMLNGNILLYPDTDQGDDKKEIRYMWNTSPPENARMKASRERRWQDPQEGYDGYLLAIWSQTSARLMHAASPIHKTHATLPLIRRWLPTTEGRWLVSVYRFSAPDRRR
jgi:hypothetical protein